MINFFYNDETPVEGVKIEFYESSAQEGDDYYALYRTRNLPMDRWRKLGEVISDTNGFYSYTLEISEDKYYGFRLNKKGHFLKSTPIQAWSKYSLQYLDTTFYKQNFRVRPYCWLKLHIKNFENNQDSLTLYPLEFERWFSGKRESYRNIRDTLYFSSYTDTTFIIQTIQIEPQENVQGQEGNFTLWRIKNEKGTEWFAHNSNYQTPTDTMEYTIEF